MLLLFFVYICTSENDTTYIYSIKKRKRVEFNDQATQLAAFDADFATVLSVLKANIKLENEKLKEWESNDMANTKDKNICRVFFLRQKLFFTGEVELILDSYRQKTTTLVDFNAYPKNSSIIMQKYSHENFKIHFKLIESAFDDFIKKNNYLENIIEQIKLGLFFFEKIFFERATNTMQNCLESIVRALVKIQTDHSLLVDIMCEIRRIEQECIKDIKNLNTIDIVLCFYSDNEQHLLYDCLNEPKIRMLITLGIEEKQNIIRCKQDKISRITEKYEPFLKFCNSRYNQILQTEGFVEYQVNQLTGVIECGISNKEFIGYIDRLEKSCVNFFLRKFVKVLITNSSNQITIEYLQGIIKKMYIIAEQEEDKKQIIQLYRNFIKYFMMMFKNYQDLKDKYFYSKNKLLRNLMCTSLKIIKQRIFTVLEIVLFYTREFDDLESDVWVYPTIDEKIIIDCNKLSIFNSDNLIANKITNNIRTQCTLQLKEYFSKENIQKLINIDYSSSLDCLDLIISSDKINDIILILVNKRINNFILHKQEFFEHITNLSKAL